MSGAWAVLRFPGSNSDHDALKALRRFGGDKAVFHWHADPITPGDYEILVLPGGFSYGDYLRAGAIAKHAVALQNLPAVIEAGCHVMGICNGFQILLESRLLPGYLNANESLRFISRTETVEVKSEAFPWFKKEDVGKKLQLPIAHGFGNYQVPKMDRSELQGVLAFETNVNGSFEKLTGVYRALGKGSVFGLMPHPERACYPEIFQEDGALLFENAKSQLGATA